MNEGEDFAERWIAAWNAMNLDRALELWAENLDFCSPLATQITGTAVLRGKAEVAAYWRAALAQAVRLRFELKEVLWDPAARTVTIIYLRSRAGDRRIAAEVIRLNDGGLGVSGLALHGAELPGDHMGPEDQER